MTHKKAQYIGLGLIGLTRCQDFGATERLRKQLDHKGFVVLSWECEQTPFLVIRRSFQAVCISASSNNSYPIVYMNATQTLRGRDKQRIGQLVRVGQVWSPGQEAKGFADYLDGSKRWFKAEVGLSNSPLNVKYCLNN